MAKWRAIHADISTSGQVNRLSEFEQLLFTWMIPHADDWGVLSGDLMELKLKVMPGTDRQCQELDGALQHMVEQDLIWRYEPDGEGPLIQFRKWDEHQPIRSDRRADPEHTLYDNYQPLPGNAGQVPTNSRLDKTRQDKTRQDKTILDKTTTSSDSTTDVDDASEELFKSNLCSLDQLGINEPKRSELAALPYVNETYLEAWAAYLGKQAAKGNKLGQGFLVRQIEANAHPWADP